MEPGDSEYGFYQLLRTPLEEALPRLLEKALGSGFRALVRTDTAERAEFLSLALWTYDPASFLPHGTAADGEAERQPVWLTAGDENPNGAELLILTDQAAPPSRHSFRRCLFLFDGREPEQLTLARDRYRDLLRAGAAIRYFEQTEDGWRLAAERKREQVS